MSTVASSSAAASGVDPAAAFAGATLPVTGTSGVVAIVGAAVIAIGVGLQGLRRIGAAARR